MNETITQISDLISKATDILIIQADNPDGDSLSSALALEQILADLGKNPVLYCAVEIPKYIRFLSGWDRVEKQLPHKIDASIIVDTSSKILLNQLEDNPDKMWVYSKPIIVLDHHQNVKCDITNVTICLNEPGYASTGELIYDMTQQLKWPLSLNTMEFLTQSILSDSLGLTSEAATAETYRRIADMIDKGVNRAKLEEQRRELSKMQTSVFQYKAKLIERSEFYGDGNEIGIVSIPEDELYTIGTLYNPAPLILSEITFVEGVKVGIALKYYKNRLTGSIRCADGCQIAHKLAEHFGGGGHPYAAGFKIEDQNINFCDIKRDVIAEAQRLINEEENAHTAQ